MRRLVKAVAFVASLVLLTVNMPSAGATTPPPSGVDQDVADIWNGLDALTSFSTGLANDGPMGDPLPDVALVPGGAGGLDFGTLFQKAVMDRLQAAGPHHFSDLATALGAANASLEANGRRLNATVTPTTQNGVERLRFDMAVARSVASQPFSLSSNSPHFAFDTGGVQVDLNLHAVFTVAYDSTSREVFIDTSAANAPSLAVTANAHFPCGSGVPAPCPTNQDTSTVRAGIGILGVSLDTGSYLSLSANFSAHINDPNGDGRLALGTFDTSANAFAAFKEPAPATGLQDGELSRGAAVAPGIMAISPDATPGSLNASLVIRPTLDGLTGVTLPSATVTVTWGDVTQGGPTVTADSSLLSAVNDFENLSPKDLAAGLARLATALESVQMSRTYDPAPNGKHGTTGAIAANAATLVYTPSSSSAPAPAAGDFFQFGDNGSVHEIVTADHQSNGTYDVTVDSPFNTAVSDGTSVTQVNAKGNVDLPFMKGSLADLFRSNEAITSFLQAHVQQLYTTLPGGRTGSLSNASGKEADYAAATGAAPQAGDYYAIGAATQGNRVVNVSGSGPYHLTFESELSGVADGAPAVQVQLGDAVPDFTSLQSLLNELTGDHSSPARFTVDAQHTAYDPNTKKLAVSLGIGRAQGTAGDLDPFTPAEQGASAAYSTNPATNKPVLTDSSKHWQNDQWAGRLVKAGSAVNTVVGNTANALALAGPWQPSAPGNGTAYQISGPDPQTGAVSFANKLDTLGNGSGIINANSSIPTATVAPSYQANITLVLDLQSAKTGNGCQGMPYPGGTATQACPFPYQAPDGTQSVIAQLPLTPDRIMLRTADANGTPLHLLTADAPANTDINVSAAVGFLKVNLGGQLHECAHFAADGTCPDPATATDHLLNVDFASAMGDAQHDIPLRDAFSRLASSPTSFVHTAVHGQAQASITASVPNIPLFTQTPTFTLTMSDITDPSSIHFDAGSFTTQLSQLRAFNFDPANPRALFGTILKTLTTLNAALKNTGDANNATIQSLVAAKIPVAGVSLGDVLKSSIGGEGQSIAYGANTVTDPAQNFTDDLIGRVVAAGNSTAVVTHGMGTVLTVGEWRGGQPPNGTAYQVENPLESAIDILTAQPSDNLQDLVDVVNGRLGAGSPLRFTVDLPSGGTPTLGVLLDWTRSFHFSAPLKFDFHIGGQSGSVVGTQASGQSSLDGTVTAATKVVLTLDHDHEAGPADADSLQIDPSATHITSSVTAGVAGHVITNIGPLAVSFGDPRTPPANQAPTNQAEGHATFSAGIQPHGSGLESFSTFLTNLSTNDVALNQNAQPVQCSGDSTPNLALCAALPVYVSTGGNPSDNASWRPVNSSGVATDPPDTVRLRLPVTTDPATEFAFSDNSGSVLHVTSDPSSPLRIDGTTDLLNDLANSVLDFRQLGQGIDGYFRFAEQSLSLASFGGKLPLVGRDLEQGSQFLQHVQAQVDTATGALNGINSADGFKSWVQNQLTTALQNYLPQNGSLDPEIICSDQLPTPTLNAPGYSGATGSPTTLTYVVTAYNANGETVASNTRAITPLVPPAPGNTVSLSWTRSAGADGYRIYRQSSAAGGWMVKADLAGESTTTTTDDGSGWSGAPQGKPRTSGDNPTLTRGCSANGTQGVTVTGDIGQGDLTNAADGCDNFDDNTSNPHNCLTAGVPLSIGVPGLSLKAADDSAANNLQVRFGWHAHLKIGLSRQRGFFIETQDRKAPELQVGLAVSLPNAIQADIAFIKINVCDAHTDTGPSAHCPFAPALPQGVTRTPSAAAPAFAGQIGLDLHKQGAPSCFTSSCTAFATNDGDASRLTLDDLTNVSDLGSLLTVGIDAGVNIDWDILADVNEALPGIGGEFKLTWNWDWSSAGGTAAGTSSVAPSTPQIEFDNVYIDAGKFLDKILRPIVTQVQYMTKPLKPIIDTLYAPIPVLSDLSHIAGGGDINLITLAETFSTLVGGPDLTMVEHLLQVVQLVNSIPSSGSDVFIGTFHVDGNTAKSTAGTPDNTNQLIGTHDDPGDIRHNVDQAAGNSQAVESGGAGAGFTFPILQRPTSIFNLLMGGDVDLIRFDSGNLTLGFSYSQSFGPVYAPPPVDIVISGGLSVTARIIAGFDTYGLRKGFEDIQAGRRDPGQTVLTILDSLFLYTTDPVKNDGKPVAVLTLQGELAAGAEVTAVIVSVGVEGGIQLTISFYWNDTDNDGKFRFGEFLSGARQNPLCLFNTEGKLSVFLEVFITVGVGPFSATFSMDIVPPITLLDFTYHPDCTPTPPELGKVVNHTLYLYFGNLGTNSLRGGQWGNDNDNPDPRPDETVKVHESHNADHTLKALTVDGLGISETFNNTDVTAVVLDARNYSGKETVTFTGDGDQTHTVSQGAPAQPFDLTAIVFGGAKDDTIKVDGAVASSRRAFVDGGAGNDAITLGDGVDVAAGGPGADAVNIGNAPSTQVDVVAGDSALTTGPDLGVDFGTSGHPNVVNTINPAGVGQPANAAAEGGASDGADTISAGLGVDHLYGDGGDDTVTIASDTPMAATNRQPGVNAASDDLIVGGTGNNHIHSGSGGDTIYAGQQWTGTLGPDNRGVAGDGLNIVDSGAGQDTVYGGSNADVLTGHSTPSNHDLIYGGAGNDVIIGGYGADHLFGGADDDYVVAEPSKVGDVVGTDPAYGPIRTVTHTAVPADTTPVGCTSTDPTAEDGCKVLVGGAGNDHLVGGNGGAHAYGDAYDQANACTTTGPDVAGPHDPVALADGDGNDTVLGGTGVELVTAGGGNDFIDAKAGDDVLCGNAGDDVIHAGDGSDHAYGGAGRDIVFGESGDDFLYGNAGNDYVFGGDGVDYIEGNEDADQLSGDKGNDRIIGGSSVAGSHDTGDRIDGGDDADIVVGDNGTITPTGAVTVFDLDGNPSSSLGGADTIYGAAGADRLYGGLDADYVSGGVDNDVVEGGPGCDTLVGNAGNDDIVGGTSPAVLPSGTAVDSVPDGCATPAAGTGNTIYGDEQTTSPGDPAQNAGYQDEIVGGNGSIAELGTTVAPDSLPQRSVTQCDIVVVAGGSCDGAGHGAAAVIGGGDWVYGGPGDDQVFAGAGDDHVFGGTGDNAIEGGPGGDTLSGGTGNNDIVGGSSPLALPTGVTTANVPDGSDTVYADGLTAAPGTPPNDGTNVVLGDNGSITRDAPAWSFGTPDPTASPTPIRHTAQLDVYDCPNGSCATPDVQGAGDFLYGGAKDDVLLGEVGDDVVSGGPPGTTSALTAPGARSVTDGMLVGNDLMEGGPGSDLLSGGAGQDDMTGGVSNAYLASGRTTDMVSDGDQAGAAVNGNTFYGGAGADVQVGGNGIVTHPLDGSQHWQLDAQNGGRFVRTVVQCDYAATAAPCDASALGGNDTMFGGAGLDTQFAGNGNDNADGGPDDDFIEGGKGSDLLTGGSGNDDIVGGTSPLALPTPTSLPAGQTSVQYFTALAAGIVDGTPDAANPGQLVGNRICGYECGQSLAAGSGLLDDDVVLGNNGEIDRCSGQQGNPLGNAACLWGYTSYGMSKDGKVSLGSPLTRYPLLLGESSAPTTHDGNDYVEGNSGNDIVYGENGNDVVHGDTPDPALAGLRPAQDECLAMPGDATAAQDVIIGGYGNNVLCGDAGDDLVIGGRATYSVVPFSGSTVTINTGKPSGGGPPNVTSSFPASGNTIYQNVVLLDPTYNPTGNAIGLGNIIFGGDGNDTVHASGGNDFVEGDNGLQDWTVHALSVVVPNDDDVVFGDNGNDSIQGGLGNDQVFGGNGEDDVDLERSPSGTAAAPGPKSDNAGGLLPVFFGTIDSYLARFPLPGHVVPSVDPGARDNGGTTSRTAVIGDTHYGGYDRDITESDGFGDRDIDSSGAYNLQYVCPAAYGGIQITRSLSPGVLTYLQQLSQYDGAVQTATPSTSGGQEVAIVYPNSTVSDNSGSAYPTTPGHFTCYSYPY